MFRTFAKATLGCWWIWLPWLVFLAHAALFRKWLIDDAGISFAYARNFVHGQGLVSQPGVLPVEGFSNPLWTLLIAPLFLSDPADPTLAIKLLSCLLMGGAFVCLNQTVRLLFEERWWARAVSFSTLLFLASCTSLVVWTTSGLENPLYVLLFALFLWQTVATFSSPADRPNLRATVIGLTVAGLALTRPDGIVFAAVFPAALLLGWYQGRTSWRSGLKQLAVFAWAAGLPVLAYLLFRKFYFGDLYPNAYHAKGGPGLRAVLALPMLTPARLNRIVLLWHGMFGWRAAGVGLLCCGLLAHLLIVRRKSSLLLMLLPAWLCAWAIYLLLPADWMGEFRFATLFVVSWALILFALLAESLRQTPLSARAQRGLFVTLSALLLLHSGYVYIPRSLAFAGEPTVPLETIAREQGMLFNYYADELGIEEASLLCPDQGGTLMFSRHRVYDLGGLCDRDIAPLIAAKDKGQLRDYLLNLQPTFVHVHEVWTERSGFFTDERFLDRYTPLREFSEDWATQRGLPELKPGDYVLKSAVATPPQQERLQQLRAKLRQAAPALPEFTPEQSRPFPRG